ncbi:histone acetyltransferase p300-like [Saccopteryx leptura]|uniref:histone acetyltransferase p300-like n=1 Tax=Saccopteryx leptura TaxID=249018 RepID=UPI00339BEF5A
MEKKIPGLDKESSNPQAAATQNPGDTRNMSFQRCIQALVHACRCEDVSCSLAPCQKMKRVVRHTKGCKWRTNGSCLICKQLISLCCYHAKHCQENRCTVPFCLNIKQRIRRQQLQYRLQQAQILRRRMASMLQAGMLGQQQGLLFPAPATLTPPPTPNPNSIPTQAEGSESQGKEPGQVTPLTSPHAAQPTCPGPQTAAEEMEMDIGNAAETPQKTPTTPMGLNPGPSEHLEPGKGPTGMQQQPPGAQGGMPQPQQPQFGMPRPAMVPVAQHGQPLNMAPQPRRGQVRLSPFKPGSASHEALKRLLQVLRSPSSPLQHQQVLSILHTNPELLLAFFDQRAIRNAIINPQSLLGQPGTQPPAMQSVNPTQAGVQKGGLPQQQPEQQLQQPMSPQDQQMNTDHDTLRQEQMTQQQGADDAANIDPGMANHNQFQEPQGVDQPPQQQQQQPQQQEMQDEMQEVQEGSVGQMDQLPQVLEAEAGASQQAQPE